MSTKSINTFKVIACFLALAIIYTTLGVCTSIAPIRAVFAGDAEQMPCTSIETCKAAANNFYTGAAYDKKTKIMAAWYFSKVCKGFITDYTFPDSAMPIKAKACFVSGSANRHLGKITKAKGLYLESCELGYSHGCRSLADMYYAQKGKKSALAALKYYKMACGNDDNKGTGCIALTKLFRNMKDGKGKNIPVKIKSARTKKEVKTFLSDVCSRGVKLACTAASLIK